MSALSALSRKLQSVLPKARFKGADEIFQLVRMIKEPEEIKLIKESVLIAEAGLKAGMKKAKSGCARERDTEGGRNRDETQGGHQRSRNHGSIWNTDSQLPGLRIELEEGREE